MLPKVNTHREVHVDEKTTTKLWAGLNIMMTGFLFLHVFTLSVP